MSVPVRLRYAVLIVAWLFPALAWGQGGTHATLQGTVSGDTGTPLAGAQVTVESRSTGSAPVVAITDDQGRYRVALLPPGRGYRVTAELAGHERVVVDPVELAPGRATELDLTLPPAGATPSAPDPRPAGIDVADTRTVTVLSGEFLADVPFLGRLYQDALTLAPGVTNVNGDGNPAVNGARPGELQYRLDGGSASDPVTGGFAHNFNLEALEEIEVITAAAPAMLGGAQGGFANLITRSGGNDLSGTVKLFYRSDLFDGTWDDDPSDGLLFPPADEFTAVQPFFSLGGPIVRDRLWYFLAMEYLRAEQTIPILAGQEVEATTSGWNNFLKFSWQATPSHRLALQMNHDPLRFEGGGLGLLVAEESAFLQDQRGLQVAARWNASFSPRVQLETALSWLDAGVDITPVSDPASCPLDAQNQCDPFQRDVLTLDVASVSGPFYLTQREDRSRLELRSDLSLWLDGGPGGHQLRTGFEAAREEYEAEFRPEPIRFDDISVAGGGLGGGGLAGTVSFLEFFPENGGFLADKDRLGLYLQDTFKPVSNLALNVGIRFDREEIEADGWTPFDPVAEGERFLELFSIGTGIPLAGLTLDQAFADASGVKFDINGDGLDDLHCRLYDLDGAVFGDGMPDGIPDDFWTYFDGDFDGIIDPNNPFDLLLMQPDGQPDGSSINPSCDFTSQDTFDLVSAFTRHQFDTTAAPFGALASLGVDRDGDGIPPFCPFGDPTCTEGEVLDPDDLPGKTRTAERFTLTSNLVSPRLSIAWDPWKDNRTQLFASWGRYYGTLPLGSIALEAFPQSRSFVYDANQISQGSAAIPDQTGMFSTVLVDRDLETPFTDEWTLGLERELGTSWVVRLAYVNREARNQLQDVAVNHYTQDSDGDGVLDDSFGGFSAGPDGVADLFIVDPFLAEVLVLGNFNSSAFESYQLELTRRLFRRWQLTSSYVYSRAEGDAESSFALVGNDPTNLGQEFAVLSYDATHVVKVSALAYLPANQTLGAIVQWSSGLPFSLIEQDLSFDSIGNLMFRTTYPTGQRNSERNEGIWIVDLSYRKRFRIRDVEAGFGVDVNNLLDEEDVRLFSVDRTAIAGADLARRFGRRWQLSLDVRF